LTPTYQGSERGAAAHEFHFLFMYLWTDPRGTFMAPLGVSTAPSPQFSGRRGLNPEFAQVSGLRQSFFQKAATKKGAAHLAQKRAQLPSDFNDGGRGAGLARSAVERV
jgi:hypothetical protein